MSALSRAQRIEIFAQALVEGATQADAYRKTFPNSAKWKAKALYTRASAFVRSKEVVGRVVALVQQTRVQHGDRVGRILQRAEEIMDVDVAELVDEHDNIIPIHKMPAHVRRAIAGIEKDEKGRVRVRLCDRLSALKLLGQHERLWNEQPGFMPPAGTGTGNQEWNFQFNFLTATPEQGAAAYQAMIRYSQRKVALAREEAAKQQVKKLPRNARVR